MSPAELSVHLTAEQALKESYPKAIRLALVITIVLHALVFMFAPEFKPAPYQLREKQEFQAIEIPDQFNVPPPPEEQAKPEVPTEIAPSDEASAEQTIQSTVFDVAAPPELPPAPTRATFFTAFDEPPQIITQVPPEYPDMARQAELEGVVMVRIFIDEFGAVVDARVEQGIQGLNDAAIAAVKKWKFKPARQRDVAVPVQIVIPIRFVLRGGG